MTKLKLQAAPVPPRAIVLDTETTGLSPRTGHRVVELAAIELVEGRPSGREFHAYLNPERTVPPEAARVHGLSTRFLRDKPRMSEVMPLWLDFVGEPVPMWAHNASFDQRFLEAEYAACGKSLGQDLLCSLKLARAVLGRGKNTLEVLADRIGARFEGRGAHSAIADTQVLACVLADLLWPAEAAAALGARQPLPSTPTPAGKDDVEASAPSFILPEGYEPATTRTDARIRRYDDMIIERPLRMKGKRWTPSEEADLATRFVDEGAEIPALVERIGRSPGALMLKLEALGVVAPDHPYARPAR